MKLQSCRFILVKLYTQGENFGYFPHSIFDCEISASVLHRFTKTRTHAHNGIHHRADHCLGHLHRASGLHLDGHLGGQEKAGLLPAALRRLHVRGLPEVRPEFNADARRRPQEPNLQGPRGENGPPLDLQPFEEQRLRCPAARAEPAGGDQSIDVALPGELFLTNHRTVI